MALQICLSPAQQSALECNLPPLAECQLPLPDLALQLAWDHGRIAVPRAPWARRAVAGALLDLANGCSDYHTHGRRLGLERDEVVAYGRNARSLDALLRRFEAAT